MNGARRSLLITVCVCLAVFSTLLFLQAVFA